MLIQNYGLFWRREHVFWGGGSYAGHLNLITIRQGASGSARRAKPLPALPGTLKGQDGPVDTLSAEPIERPELHKLELTARAIIK